jgi:non-heme chloroperoxidase
MFRPHDFRTRDGVRLHYLEAGRGHPIVFLPGWSQTAALFDGQIADFNTDHHCLALDWRGHGESDRPARGYRHARFASDLEEWLGALDLYDVTLVGHSMACAIIWNYLELFGFARIARLVLNDQSPRLLIDSAWSERERLIYGGQLDYPALEAFCAKLSGPDGETTTREMLTGMFTAAFPKAGIERVILENLKFPRALAAHLLRETFVSDLRDLLPQITVPTLVLSGLGSHLPHPSQEWIHQQIPGSSLATTPADQGGSHFCFLENPAAFNQHIRRFLQDHPLP